MKAQEERGITLISLVVTIIVILILTGIAIRFAVGQDEGIITKTNQAVEGQTVSQIKEEVSSAWSSATIDYMKNKKPFSNTQLSDYLLDKSNINPYLEGKGRITKNPIYDEEEGYYIIHYQSEEIEPEIIINITEKGNVKNYDIAEVNENIYVTLYSDGTLVFDNTPNTIEGKELEEGTETWNITGKSYDFDNRVPWEQSKLKIIEVDFANDIVPVSTKTWFYSCANLEKINNISNLNTKNVTDMSYMFEFCNKLKSIDVSDFNTKNVTDMSYMFGFCEELESLKLGRINTSNVTNMEEMFTLCKKIKDIDVSSFNTSKVENMHGMFWGLYGIENIDISNFEIKRDCDVSYMFANCEALKNIYAKKEAIENERNLYDLGVFSCCGTGVMTSKTDGVVFGYNIEKGYGWSASNNDYQIHSARGDRASTNKIFLNPEKKYKITMSGENFDFGCMNNPKTYDSGWMLPGSITIENNRCIVCNFAYQRAHTANITDAMIEEIFNNFEIKVIE